MQRHTKRAAEDYIEGAAPKARARAQPLPGAELVADAPWNRGPRHDRAARAPSATDVDQPRHTAPAGRGVATADRSSAASSGHRDQLDDAHRRSASPSPTGSSTLTPAQRRFLNLHDEIRRDLLRARTEWATEDHIAASEESLLKDMAKEIREDRRTFLEAATRAADRMDRNAATLDEMVEVLGKRRAELQEAVNAVRAHERNIDALHL